MSKYYIYKMTALTEDGSKGSYIGQHKIGRRSPLNDGYKGSGKQWKKYILQRNIPTEKVILRMCDNIEQANYWEKFYIKQAKEDGIYLWNRCKGGGNHEYNKQYTEEELKEHRKQWREANKQHIAEYQKQYSKQWRDANREKRAEYHKQWNKANKQQLAEYQKQWYEANKQQLAEYQKQWYEANKEQIAEYKKEYYKANKEHKAEYNKQYYSQPCLYNGETLTLSALRTRFRKAGITNSTAEAKKYLIEPDVKLI